MSFKRQQFFFLILVCLTIIFTPSCGKGEKEQSHQATSNQYLADFVSAFTSGELSKRDLVQVVFSSNLVLPDELMKPLDESPIKVEPVVAGTATWVNASTLEFKPEQFLDAGTSYTCSIDLSLLFKDVPEDIKDFQFNIYTPARAFEMQFGNLMGVQDKGIKHQHYRGTLMTSDFEEDSLIEKLLSAKQEGVTLPITWDHSEDGRMHQFHVKDIERKNKDTKLILKWSGNIDGYDFTGEKNIVVPSSKYFVVQSVTPMTSPEQYISILFTDPIMEDQDLLGLIHIQNHNLRFVVNGNEVKVYISTRLAGELTLKIEPGINNILGVRFNDGQSHQLQFEEMKPKLRLTGKKVIIPDSGKVLFPFEAVNVSAIDLQITKIFERNIMQFFQVNSLEGEYELWRVGETVLRKKIELDQENQLDLKTWNRHILDLSTLVQMDPGAIYQISLAFRPSYSLYTCAQEISMGEDELEPVQESDTDPSFWDYYQNEPYYRYTDRRNPCHRAYYGSRTMVKRNVLSSNLGIIAKGDKKGTLLISVTDLISSNPLGDVNLDVYDFQQNLISSARSDRNGQASIQLNDKQPFLVVASKGRQRGYLKVSDSNALTVSRFDVGGTKTEKGINGYIYGDRGVWRPGDTLYLNFILQDKNHVLPENHPVSFEFRDPQYRLIMRRNLTENLNGFYPLTVKTEQDAPTGTYDATIKVGGSTFRKSIKIETIKPNRLKIQLDLEDEELVIQSKKYNADLTLKWLHGALAQNLKADIDVRLSPTKTKFNRYDGFAFDDPMTRYNSEEQRVFSGKVNEKGQAKVQFNLLSESRSPGMLKAHFLCKAYEPSGEFSVDRFSVPVHPFKVYAGISLPKGDKKRGMLLTDMDHKIEVVTVNEKGEPVQRTGVKVAVYKLSWRWWWDQSADQETQYHTQNLASAISQGTLDTDEKGEGTWALRINYPDWGRYLVRVIDPDGHVTGKITYIDWPGWAGRQRENQPGGAAMLSFTADKVNVKAGQPITLSIPSSATGRALVSIETGQEILETHWVKAQEGVTHFTFNTNPDMAPNIYVHVTLIQPHSQTANDLPIRLYGVIPILVENPETKLNPILKMPDTLKPDSEIEIEVSELNGKSMTYTIAVVDDGLLDLTRFSTPNPWEFFNARQASMVKTWDMYDSVLGAFGGEMKALLSIGGGDEGGKPSVPKANRFKPVVLYEGPFQLKAGKNSTHRLQMPNYIGSVRTMLIAGDSNRFGSTDKTTPVRKPLMLLGTLPRVLGPGEEVLFPLSVFAMEEHVKEVEVTIETNNLFIPQGSKSQHLTFSQAGDKAIQFPLIVSEMVGIGKIKATAVSGSEKAVFEIEIDIRNANPYLQKTVFETLKPGETRELEVAPVGIAGTNSGYLELSSIPPLNLAQRLDFLIHYPHGCIEQTTSAVFPQLFLNKLLELSIEEKNDIEANIKAGIKRIHSFQLSNGGLGYWPGSAEPSDWGTSYAGHFMLSAKKLGYALPPDFMAKWTSYQRLKANSWTKNSINTELMQAYRLYLLAQSGQPELGAMNRFKESGIMQKVTHWMLAAAYHIAGQPEIASQMTANLETDVDMDGKSSLTFGSPLRDTGIILETMVAMSDKRASKVATLISQSLNNDKWYNTQALGFCLASMGAYTGNGVHQLIFSKRIGDDQWSDSQFAKPLSRFSIEVDELIGQTIAVKNTQQIPLYLSYYLRGQPAAGAEQDAANQLKIVTEYRDSANKVIDPVALQQGTDFIAMVTVVNPGGNGNYTELALSQIFPSGWEIHNPSMGSHFSAKGIAKPKYRDIRDDRVLSYFDLDSGKSKTFIVYLNASYRGKFYLPAVQAETMYDHRINAQKSGKWIEVSAVSQ